MGRAGMRQMMGAGRTRKRDSCLVHCHNEHDCFYCDYLYFCQWLLFIIYYPCNYVDGSDNDADNDTDNDADNDADADTDTDAVRDANAGAC